MSVPWSGWSILIIRKHLLSQSKYINFLLLVQLTIRRLAIASHLWKTLRVNHQVFCLSVHILCDTHLPSPQSLNKVSPWLLCFGGSPNVMQVKGRLCFCEVDAWLCSVEIIVVALNLICWDFVKGGRGWGLDFIGFFDLI